MSLHEIVLAQTKPATEWVRGRALQKIRGDGLHAALQGQLAIAFIGWAARGLHGRVAVEWRFRVAPPGKIVRPLVPDLAYVSYGALGHEASDEDVAVPLGAPTVAAYIIAAEDLSEDVDDRIATLLEAGTSAVMIVDPKRETIAVHGDGHGTGHESNPVTYGRCGGELLKHDSLPGFALEVAELFVRAKR